MQLKCRAIGCEADLQPSFCARYSWGFRSSWVCTGKERHRWQRFHHPDGRTPMSESEARAILSDLARNGQRKVASMLRTEGVRQRR